MQVPKSLALFFLRTKFKILSSISKQKAARAALQLFISPQTRSLKVLPEAFKGAEPLHLKFESKTLYGYRWNKGATKKLLILHGFESSVINFERYIKPLIKKEYEILAFDAPAHGKSEGKTLNAIEYKNLVHYLFNHYGPITAFITHSFGGLALSLALENIHHDSTMKVVLIAPATESTTAINNFFKFLKLGNSFRKEFEELITRANNKPPEWYSVSRAAENIKAQVLFLQDRDDILTPLSDVLPIMDKGYPNFKFIISEGLGHRRIYRDEKTIQHIIDFL